MKVKAQKAQIIRNSLGASVRTKAQKAQINRSRLGQLFFWSSAALIITIVAVLVPES